jgi:hypothetical protein
VWVGGLHVPCRICDFAACPARFFFNKTKTPKTPKTPPRGFTPGAVGEKLFYVLPVIKTLFPLGSPSQAAQNDYPKTHLFSA